MKSMSISAHGRSRLNCVCRCSNGFCRAREPGDPHLRRRERVHPRDQPDAGGSAFAARHSARIDSGVVADRLRDDAHRDPALGVERAGDRRACASTCSRLLSPYMCWLPAAGTRPRSSAERLGLTSLSGARYSLATISVSSSTERLGGRLVERDLAVAEQVDRGRRPRRRARSCARSGSSRRRRAASARDQVRISRPSRAPIAASGSSSSRIVAPRVDRARDRDRLALAAREHRHLGVDRAQRRDPDVVDVARAPGRRIARLLSQLNGPTPRISSRFRNMLWETGGPGPGRGPGRRCRSRATARGRPSAGVTSSPLTKIRPAVGLLEAGQMILISVDLPAPLSPTSAEHLAPGRGASSRRAARRRRRSASAMCSTRSASGGAPGCVGHLQPPEVLEARDLDVQRSSRRGSRAR